MVFVRSVFFKSTFVDASNVQELYEILELPLEESNLYKNGKKINFENELQNDDTVEIVFSGLLGGKGGFGSMLRALGNQIQKTTNKEAMRDLSGRRIRDINQEKRLKNYVNKKAEREQEKAEKKEAKLKKLHKLVTPGESKHEFKDEKYDEAREAATDRVHDAMNEVFSNPELKPSVSGVKRKANSSSDEENNEKKKKVEEKKPVKGAGRDLFLGVDLDDSDLEDSSDEEDAKKN